MAILRFNALEQVFARKPVEFELPKGSISDHFGVNVFGRSAMRNYLTEDTYRQVRLAMEEGVKLERSIADNVATSMKAWAIGKGATHYTHWFQPLTGLTAEKHNAFFDLLQDGTPLERFDGNQLVQQEPDASSFPSGGIRNTFEARGYTAWDPTSPSFVMGTTLCIPTIFVSYTGEALDYKAPLLKALQAIDKASVAVCKYFEKDVEKVSATLGWEQEYFLIDSALYNARPDLVLTGRTLFGRSSSKGQQLDDHYFGSIPERAAAFIRDLEFQALKLGIPVKTRHNEVAPNQFECAPVFEEANLAVDHNQLLMDLMGKIAAKHNLKVLLHEKPFAEINGSGKHCNWSLVTSTGKNLLSPGSTPRNNLRFLTFFINTIKVVHDHAGLLRASIASAGNDHRLGANEAPPAIISVFIGSQLSAMLDEIEKRVPQKKMTEDQKSELKLDIGKIPQILRDNTDRNRTSPFAFTGDKFEFRAVGASANCASAMIVLNTIVAQQLFQFEQSVEAMIKGGAKRDEAIFKTLRSYIVDSRPVRFEGNGYSKEWVLEAEKRGLANIRTAPHSFSALTSEATIGLYEGLGIMTAVEADARCEIELENYKLKLEIESGMLADLALNSIIPVAIRYQSRLLANVEGLHKLGPNGRESTRAQVELIEAVAHSVNTIHHEVKRMRTACENANGKPSLKDRATAFCDNVKPYFDTIRKEVDGLETIIDDELWPLPKYRELLFN